MDAIEYLTIQHQEIESLFDQIESAARPEIKRRLRRKLFDLLAVHAAVEEMLFYPAAQGGVEELFPRVFEEHAALEHLVAEIVALRGTLDEIAGRLSALKQRKAQHARREEEELFPRVRKLLTPYQLESVGGRMANVADELMGPGVGVRERLAARRAMA